MPPENITWMEADPGNRESLLSQRRGRPGLLDLLDHRRAQAEGRLRRALLRGPPGPAGPPQRGGDHRAGDPRRPGPLLGGRHHLGRPRSRSSSRATSICGSTRRSPTASPPWTASEVDAVTTDDVILAGFAGRPEYQGKLKVVGKGFSDELYGVGMQEGRQRRWSRRSTTALKQYIDDGSWKPSLDTDRRSVRLQDPRARRPRGADRRRSDRRDPARDRRADGVPGAAREVPRRAPAVRPPRRGDPRRAGRCRAGRRVRAGRADRRRVRRRRTARCSSWSRARSTSGTTGTPARQVPDERLGPARCSASPRCSPSARSVRGSWPPVATEVAAIPESVVSPAFTSAEGARFLAEQHVGGHPACGAAGRPTYSLVDDLIADRSAGRRPDGRRRTRSPPVDRAAD